MSPSTRRETISALPWCRSACRIKSDTMSGVLIINACIWLLLTLFFILSRRNCELHHSGDVVIPRPSPTIGLGVPIVAGIGGRDPAAA
jgi:hypothetical protein